MQARAATDAVGTATNFDLHRASPPTARALPLKKGTSACPARQLSAQPTSA